MENELWIIADSIRKMREFKGLTQEQLAEKADISVSHLAKIETHIRVVGMKTYIKLLNAMEVPVKAHFSYIGTNSQDILIEEKIWELFQDCSEKEIFLLICSIKGMKKGLREYQENRSLLKNI